MKEVFPLSARRRAASDLLATLDAQFIEALHEWESVYAGAMKHGDITDRRLKLMQRRLDAELGHLAATGLPERRNLVMLAKSDANAYFEAMFEELT